MSPNRPSADVDALIERHRLVRARGALRGALEPAVALRLAAAPSGRGIDASRFGGDASVPRGFQWPKRRGRPLDFLMQVNLRDIAHFESAALMPRTGLLAFFYDVQEQPWGFDPADLDGFRVVSFDEGTELASAPAPNPKCRPDPRAIEFEPRWTLPNIGSRAYERAIEPLDLTDEESDDYFELRSELGSDPSAKSLPEHQMFGHPDLIQNDLQLEAQLVAHGLYCGDTSAYDHPRRAELEPGAADWILLLQVDSGERAGRRTLDWGDAGMLYWWIRRDDLRARRFDRVWAALQCC